MLTLVLSSKPSGGEGQRGGMLHDKNTALQFQEEYHQKFPPNFEPLPGKNTSVIVDVCLSRTVNIRMSH